MGDPDLAVEVTGTSLWTVNNTCATHRQKDRVFVMRDAAHRHPPSNGLGSNTSIQDAFNLCWTLAAVLKNQAGPALPDSCSQERVPIAKQIVTRANQSIGEFGPIFEAIGMDGEISQDGLEATLDAMAGGTPEAEATRKALREAIAFKKYEFDAHGVEMNQCYASSAVVTDGQPEPGFAQDPESRCQPTTWPGARVPRVWLFDDRGGKVSTLDLAGQGGFTLFTGPGGAPWAEAAGKVALSLGIKLRAHVIEPRRPLVDNAGDWARAREIGDPGCVMTRPDQHVCWRSADLPDDPAAELTRVLSAVLAR